MNHHAEKLIDPRSEEEAARLSPALGALVQEFHTCPGCGLTASRPGT